MELGQKMNPKVFGHNDNGVVLRPFVTIYLATVLFPNADNERQQT